MNLAHLTDDQLARHHHTALRLITGPCQELVAEGPVRAAWLAHLHEVTAELRARPGTAGEVSSDQALARALSDELRASGVDVVEWVERSVPVPKDVVALAGLLDTRLIRLEGEVVIVAEPAAKSVAT